SQHRCMPFSPPIGRTLLIFIDEGTFAQAACAPDICRHRGSYLLVADDRSVSPAMTHIDLYRPTLVHGELIQAVRSWAAGSTTACPPFGAAPGPCRPLDRTREPAADVREGELKAASEARHPSADRRARPGRHPA